MQLKLFSLVLLIPFLSAEAQLSSFDYNGYVKYLFSNSKYPNSSERYTDHLIHSRLNTRWYPTLSLTGALELRFRAYYGETVENTPNFLDMIKTKFDFADLGKAIWNEKNSVGYLEIDRLWFDWVKNDFEATIGRQRIAWGTCWVWNPTDIFNPLNILDFDYEERPATDAIRLQYYTGAVTKVELDYKPAKKPEDQILAGLWSINHWNYDFNFIAGMRFKRWLAGFSWVGDILDAGFRGEILMSQASNLKINNPAYQKYNEVPLSSFDKPLVTIALSGDYTFPNTVYIHTEVLYNNNGKTSNTFLFSEEAMNLGMLSAARWSLYQEFSYDITPLIRGSLFGIFNPDDDSYAIVPSVTYSVFTNLDFLAISQIFNGKQLTEFGEYGTSFFFRFKYSF